MNKRSVLWLLAGLISLVVVCLLMKKSQGIKASTHPRLQDSRQTSVPDVPDAVKTVQKAHRMAGEAKESSQQDSDAYLRQVEAATAIEQKLFDELRAESRQKTNKLLQLRDQLNQTILGDSGQGEIVALNERLESEARELQDAQVRMNAAYVSLQRAKERAIDEIIKKRP